MISATKAISEDAEGINHESVLEGAAEYYSVELNLFDRPLAFFRVLTVSSCKSGVNMLQLIRSKAKARQRA
jgi:hypothetical protein